MHEEKEEFEFWAYNKQNCNNPHAPSLSSLSFVSLTLFDTFSCNMKPYNTFFERKQKVPFLFFENSLSMTFVSLQHCIYVFWRAYPISCMFIWFSHALRNSTVSWTSNLKKECTKYVFLQNILSSLDNHMQNKDISNLFSKYDRIHPFHWQEIVTIRIGEVVVAVWMHLVLLNVPERCF